MNLFFLSLNPRLAASYVFDCHAIKMPLESMQMLSTCARILCPQHANNTNLYASVHTNHPSTIWTRTSAANFNWVTLNCAGLFEEYTKRYGKVHQSELKFQQLTNIFDDCKEELIKQQKIEITPIALAMPIEFKRADPVLSYRLFYMHKIRVENEKIEQNTTLRKDGTLRKIHRRMVWQKLENIPAWYMTEPFSHVSNIFHQVL